MEDVDEGLAACDATEAVADMDADDEGDGRKASEFVGEACTADARLTPHAVRTSCCEREAPHERSGQDRVLISPSEILASTCEATQARQKT